MLASVSDGGVVTLDGFQVDESISITEDGNQQSYRLASGDTWTSLPSRPLGSGITGIGTDTLTIDQSVTGRVQVVGNNIGSPNVDVVFASDINGSTPLIFRIDSVTQLSGTAVNVNDEIRAETIRLPEASNRFTGDSLFADFVSIRSATPINLASLNVGNGTVASDAGITLSSRNDLDTLHVSGQLTLESGGSINIETTDINVTGRLNLSATDDIRIDSSNIHLDDTLFNGISSLARLNFQAGGDVDISLTERWLDFSGPSDASNFALVGDNFAQNFSLNYERARLINAPGVTVNVAGDADLTINSSFLASNSNDEINVAGDVFIKTVPFIFTEGGGQILSESVVSIREPGDVRFGSLEVEDARFLTVHEDDSTLLLGAGGNSNAQQVTIRSAADIVVQRTAVVESQGALTLEAEGDLIAERGQNKTIKGQRLVLRGETINLDQVDGATVNFNSPGDVTLFAPQNFTLRGSNTGRVVRVTAGERIASTPSATLDARWLEMRGRSIWLANQTASDRISVNGRANFFATDFVIVGLAGTVETRLMNFQTDFANIAAEGNLTLIGDNTASAARVRATENIFDVASTTIEFLERAELTAQSVHVGDQADNEFTVCGHVNFNVTDFANVDADGLATIGTWRVNGGRGNIIHADSRAC